ncbi:hypothetical protein GCM10012285_59820 [Streptomyces kronopolitis]|uniref:Integral membrane protein n=1 Tax=Streptomyces kronopolitis TaxID=1612435 RepID=A0ABQ2K071_9ACTN|nr:DUF5336 domain-containing protein [Streptomyces kronopolitis]GGN61105.1 hypothetical protein GCM10012285_59820 [Streptomyces kronopolitis]
MNIRSLTRGDGVVIGAAVLLFIASFLSFTGSPDCSGLPAKYCQQAQGYASPNAWDALPTLMSMYLAGVIGAAIVVLSRLLPQQRKVAGLDPAQFGVALTLFAAWTGLWTVIGSTNAGAGLIIGLIATLILAGGAVATPLVPPLKVALVGAPKPQPAAAPYGAGPNPGYGYPGAQQQAGHGYGYPGAQQQPQGGQAYGQQAPVADGTAGGQTGATQAAGAPSDFAPFWFAVPVARPLYGEDGSPAPIAELAPGTWYLAVEQRGQALIAQTQDGRRGVLQDTTGIQRG